MVIFSQLNKDGEIGIRLSKEAGENSFNKLSKGGKVLFPVEDNFTSVRSIKYYLARSKN